MALRIDREWALALIQFLQSLDGETAAAGRRLAEGRAVTRLTYGIEKKRFAARVNDPERSGIRPALVLEGGAIRAECDCAAAMPCAHTVATAVTVLGEAFRRGSAYRREIKPALPHAWRFGATQIPEQLFKQAEAMFEQDKARAAARARQDEPRAKPPAGQPTAPVAPPTEPAEPIHAKPKGPPIQVVMRLVQGPDGRFPVPVWSLFLRSGGTPARPCTAREIKQLGRELTGKREEKWHAARNLVAWLLEASDLEPAYWLGTDVSKKTFEVRNLKRWLVALEGGGLVRWRDGRPLRLGRETLMPALASAADGRPAWALAARGADGREKHGGEVFTLGQVALFIDPEYPGTLYALRRVEGEPVTAYPVTPGEVKDDELLTMRKAGEVGLGVFTDPVRAARLLARMAEAMLARERGRGGVQRNPWVEVAPVRPVVELRHKRNSWIWAAAYAVTPSGRVFMREGPGHWEAVVDPELTARWTECIPANEEEDLERMEDREGGIQKYEGDKDKNEHDYEHEHEENSSGEELHREPLIVLPRPGDLEAVEQWLARFIPFAASPQPPAGGRHAFQWYSSDVAVDALRREWAQRPAGVEFYGNNAFLRLTDQRRRPALNVEVRPSDVDWLWVSAELEEELAGLTADAIARMLEAATDILIRLPDGRSYTREGLAELLGELRALEELGIRPGDGGRRLHALQLAGGGRRALEGKALAPLETSLRGLAETFKGIPSAAIDEAVAARLRPYQSTGADFLVWAGQTLGGALLADDMGLGKTIELLAALTALRRAAGEAPPPSLVVCPASVAHNWRREAERFCPGLNVRVLEAGAARQRDLKRLQHYDLVVINYSLARRDAATLAAAEWLVVCVDEAQAIKNPRSEIAAAVRALPARHRFALTGTPVENRLDDLVSIMDFALPGYLGNLREEALRDPLAEPGLARCLRARLRPVLLRRLKREVAPELPDRIEERVDCEMGDAQRRLYLAEVARARQALRGWDGGEGRMHIFAALTRLRQLCCEPALLGQPHAGSAKIDELLDQLPVLIDEGHKVLIFSQFVTMLDLLEPRLAPLKVPIYKLTGQTRNRLELVERFECDPRPGVFLISLKAGGTGLNLVSASHVVLFDPWWNPAVEAQAIDRAHRIGQDKTVVALRLVTRGTIEERILELQARKRELVENVLGDEGFGAALSREDIEFLLADVPGQDSMPTKRLVISDSSK